MGNSDSTGECNAGSNSAIDWHPVQCVGEGGGGVEIPLVGDKHRSDSPRGSHAGVSLEEVVHRYTHGRPLNDHDQLVSFRYWGLLHY